MDEFRDSNDGGKHQSNYFLTGDVVSIYNNNVYFIDLKNTYPGVV